MTKLNKRLWKRFCSSDDLPKIGEIQRLVGPPESYCDGEEVKYKPGVFQVVVKEDGISLQASLCRRIARRNFYRFLAYCEVPRIVKSTTRTHFGF
jgi:hypothetical protein